jgi:hypothetical protein
MNKDTEIIAGYHFLCGIFQGKVLLQIPSMAIATGPLHGEC